MRYFKATVEYDGTDFAGFQFQHDARTVQGVLEAAIKERTGQQLRLVGAGRTTREYTRSVRSSASDARPAFRWKRWQSRSTALCRPT